MRYSASPSVRLRRQLAAALLVGLLFFNQFASALSGPMKMALSSSSHASMTMADLASTMAMTGTMAATQHVDMAGTASPCHHEQPASSCHGAACCLCHLSPALALACLHPAVITTTPTTTRTQPIYDSLMASEQLRPPAILLV